MRKKDGFTLIELIVVIAILGILALFLVPSFIGYAQDAKKAVCDSNLTSINRAYQATLTKLGSDEAEELLTDVMNNKDNEYFSTMPKCPDVGDYLIEAYTTEMGKTAYRVKCTIHSKTTSTIPVQITDQIQDLFTNREKYEKFNGGKAITDTQLKSNDFVRKVLKEANGGKWPILTLGDSNEYYVQPYMDTFGDNASNDIYVFATSSKSDNYWGASFIYEEASGLWYQAPDKKQTIMISGLSFNEVKEKMEDNGWVPVEPTITGEIILP